MYILRYAHVGKYVYIDMRLLWLSILSLQGRQRAVSRIGVVRESLPVSQACDSSGFRQPALSSSAAKPIIAVAS